MTIMSQIWLVVMNLNIIIISFHSIVLTVLISTTADSYFPQKYKKENLLETTAQHQMANRHN